MARGDLGAFGHTDIGWAVVSSGHRLFDVALKLRAPLLEPVMEGVSAETRHNPKIPPWASVVAWWIFHQLAPADIRLWSFNDDSYVAVIQAHWFRRQLWSLILHVARIQYFTDRGRLVAFRGTRPTNLPEVQRETADVVIRRSRPGIYTESRLRTFDPAGSASITVDSLCPDPADEVLVRANFVGILESLRAAGIRYTIRSEREPLPLPMIIDIEAPDGWTAAVRGLIRAKL